MSDLHYEDFHVGQRFTSRAETMTRDRIIAYAEEFDPQPQHLSEEAAARSNFGQLVASGWHTASLTIRLQHDSVFSRIPGGGMGAGIDKLAWLRPVRPGETLHVQTEVQDMRVSASRPERGIVKFLTTTVNQDGEPVQTLLGTVLVPRRPSP